MKRLILSFFLAPALCFAQSSSYTPPPLVNAPTDPPPATQPPQGAPPQGAPTPMPPGYDTPPPGYVSPSGQPYAPPPAAVPYSPYGQPYIPSGKIETGPEVGLMITETAFGALTAATTSLLGYYLLLKPLRDNASFDSTVTNVLFVVVFAAVPMAVSQTELSLANGSRYYYSDAWPSMLAGLLSEAAVVGLYYWLRPSMPDGGEALLLAGTIGFVPIAEMVMINLTKTPRYKLPMGGGGWNYRGAFNFSPGEGLQAGLPTPAPLIANTSRGLTLGIGIPVLAGRF